LLVVPASAALSTDSPVHFFTKVASRLLHSDLGIDLQRIPVYPTNHYTPSVHRLLQVTANLYDSTTTNWYPTIFRPTFSSEGTNLFISGYEEVDATNPAFLSTPNLLADVANGITPFSATGNFYEVPWVIGVKKGLPGFNKLLLNSIFVVTRRVQVSRPSREAMFSTYTFGQQEIISLNHEFGVQLWNPYLHAFPYAVQARAEGRVRAILSRNAGYTATREWEIDFAQALESWPGITNRSSPRTNSFVIPGFTNMVQLQNQVFNTGSNLFQDWSGSFDPLELTSPSLQIDLAANVRVFIRDVQTGRILDYVQFSGPTLKRNLSEELRTNGRDFDGLWNTNVVGSSNPPRLQGVNYQLRISQGLPQSSDSEWSFYGRQTHGGSRAAAIARFKAFMLGASASFEGTIAQNPTNLVMEAPFAPMRQLAGVIVWEANDPLVHYTFHDLTNLAEAYTNLDIKPATRSFSSAYLLNQLSGRYSPWGGQPQKPVPDSQDYRLQDSRVWSANDWNFPKGEPLSLANLGQIHRGTPWQTIYLKSEEGISLDAAAKWYWMLWTGNVDWSDAMQTIPVRDRTLVNVLAPMLRTNSARDRFSINEPNPERWRGLMHGLVVITNSEPEALIVVHSNEAPAMAVADAIASARASLPGGYFRKAGDLLSIPTLSDQSPWLAPFFPPATPSDAAMEALPSALLPLLRDDSIGEAKPIGGMLVLQFSAEEGETYVLEGSDNLLEWMAIQTNAASADHLSFSLSQNAAERTFLRTRLQ